jgi:peptide/nickel transport system substrate-binding protein/microcin C transport system substrate-binding protein
MLKKGQLDFMNVSADIYTRKTGGPMWGKSVFKVKTQNLLPKGYEFIAWNLDLPIFRDRRVRIALAHLLDRETMIQKFYHGMKLPATGPWYRQSRYADPDVQPLQYDPTLALRLLREAGWQDRDRDGTLEKRIEGRIHPLSFTLLTGPSDALRWVTIFQEDAKQAGVEIRIKQVGWNAIAKLVDDRQFDAVQMEWEGSLVDFDPKPIWHSSGAVKGGINFPGYRNAKVDRLIEAARQSIDPGKREPLLREAFRIIAHDAPYLVAFNDAYTLYIHSNRVGRPADTLKYDVGVKYWWIRPEREGMQLAGSVAGNAVATSGKAKPEILEGQEERDL